MTKDISKMQVGTINRCNIFKNEADSGPSGQAPSAVMKGSTYLKPRFNSFSILFSSVSPFLSAIFSSRADSSPSADRTRVTKPRPSLKRQNYSPRLGLYIFKDCKFNIEWQSFEQFWGMLCAYSYVPAYAQWTFQIIEPDPRYAYLVAEGIYFYLSVIFCRNTFPAGT